MPEPIVMDGEIVEETAGVAVTRPAQSTAVAATSADIAGMFKLALEHQVPVELMDKLLDLQERVMARDARAAFFNAKSQFQAECPDVRKSKTANITSKSTGAKFSYTYAPLESITRTIDPILAKHGLSYSWDVVDVQGKILNVVCVLRHVDGHEDRSTFPVPIDSDARMSVTQAMGAALTYGKRQSLISVLGLTTADEDTDAAQREPKSVGVASREDIANIQALMDEVGANRVKFLKHFGIQKLEELPASTVPLAIRTLEGKRGQGGAS